MTLNIEELKQIDERDTVVLECMEQGNYFKWEVLFVFDSGNVLSDFLKSSLWEGVSTDRGTLDSLQVDCALFFILKIEHQQAHFFL